MKTGKSVLDAIGASTITVWFPCEQCDHPLESHNRPTPDGGGTRACGMPDAIHRDGHLGPCDCLAFVGELPDGTPKGIRMRQLTPLEWIKIGQGRGVPVALGDGPDHIDQEQSWRQYEWLRAIVQHATSHVRVWDDSAGRARWQRVQVKPSDEPVDNEQWELSIDQLDRAGLVAALASAVIRDLNQGGPFCGHIRRQAVSQRATQGTGDDGGDGRAGGDAAARGGDVPTASAR